MTNPENIISFFCFEQPSLKQSDLHKIIIYCGSKIDVEKWNITIENGWVSGYCEGEDTGKFYEFLQKIGLSKIIEIIRG